MILAPKHTQRFCGESQAAEPAGYDRDTSGDHAKGVLVGLSAKLADDQVFFGFVETPTNMNEGDSQRLMNSIGVTDFDQVRGEKLKITAHKSDGGVLPFHWDVGGCRGRVPIW